MKIARVQRTESGILQMDASFVPPLLDIDSSDFLMSILRRLLEILTAEAGTLRHAAAEESGSRRFHGIGYREFLASLHRKYLLAPIAPRVRDQARPSRIFVLQLYRRSPAH